MTYCCWNLINDSNFAYLIKNVVSCSKSTCTSIVDTTNMHQLNGNSTMIIVQSVYSGHLWTLLMGGCIRPELMASLDRRPYYRVID